MPITIPSGSTFTRSNRTRTWLSLVGVLVALVVIAWLTLNAISSEVRRQVAATLTSTLQMAQTVGTRFLEHQRDTTQLIADSPTPQRLSGEILRGDESKREPLTTLLAGLLATQDF